jgi:hypothetical protein
MIPRGPCPIQCVFHSNPERLHRSLFAVVLFQPPPPPPPTCQLIGCSWPASQPAPLPSTHNARMPIREFLGIAHCRRLKFQNNSRNCQKFAKTTQIYNLSEKVKVGKPPAAQRGSNTKRHVVADLAPLMKRTGW